MELEEIDISDFGKTIERIKEEAPSIPVDEYMKQFDPEKHDVHDESKRKDREIYVDERDSSGNIVKDDEGNPKSKKERIPVNRQSVPFQQMIVDMAVAFLCGNPIELVANPTNETEERMLQAVKQTWLDNKLDYKTQQIARIIKSETVCAEIWYKDKVDNKFILRMKIISEGSGDSLYPVFNSMGNLIAYGRGYKSKIGKKEVEKFDLYLDKTRYKATKKDGVWEVESEPITGGKIPVIHGQQDKPEWWEIQHLIDRYETLISNHGDTNDKHGDPSIVVKGQLVGNDKKGEYGGQVYIVEGDGADAKYMAWDHVVNSIELEIKTKRKDILYFSNTPDISLEEMKSLGTFSGIALKMLFLAAHLKAAKSAAGFFGEYIQRRINYIKAALAAIDVTLASAVNMVITPKFEYFLPKNDLEKIETIVQAVTGKIMSEETGVRNNPLVEDADTELDKLKEEAKNQLNIQFNEA